MASDPGRPGFARFPYVTAILWCVVAPFVVWAAVRVAGLDRGSPLVQLIAFTPYIALAAPVPVILAAALRRWSVLVVAAASCVAFVACLLPRVHGAAEPIDGTTFRVMSVNLYAGRADASAIVALVRDRAVDALAVQELTPAAQRRLEQAGLSALLPYVEAHPYPGVDGSAVYARFPIVAGSVKINPGAGFRQASAAVRLDDAVTVTVESVHPVSPSGVAMTAFWAQGLREQTPATTDPARPHVLAGDFNATLDHVELRRLLDTGYTDAADAVGAGLVPTWPYGTREYAGIPAVTIDHVLVPDPIGVAGFDAVTVANTDHRAIIAVLVIPAVGGPAGDEVA